jgi:hypothetical protein
MLVLMRRLVFVLAVLATFAATASAEAKQLVRYGIYGGIAGMNETLTVSTGGTAKQSGKRTSPRSSKVSSKELRGLKHDLKAAHFKTLKKNYRPHYVVNDGITQTVTYKGHTVSVSTGSKAPKRLQPVLERLARLLQRR